MSVNYAVVVAFVGFLVVAASALTGAVVYLLFHPRRRIHPADRSPQLLEVGGLIMTPLETGMDAVERMTPAEREAFRSWLDGHWPRPPGGEGVMS